MGIAFAKLGAKVTIVEALPKILPLYDAELTQPVVRRLADLGVETLVGARALGFADGALKVAAADGKERAFRRRQGAGRGWPSRAHEPALASRRWI